MSEGITWLVLPAKTCKGAHFWGKDCHSCFYSNFEQVGTRLSLVEYNASTSKLHLQLLNTSIIIYSCLLKFHLFSTGDDLVSLWAFEKIGIRGDCFIIKSYVSLSVFHSN